MTFPLEITPLERVLEHLKVSSLDQLILLNEKDEGAFEKITKLREFLNGKLFAFSTFDIIFKLYRKSPQIMENINIKRIRLAPNLWIVIGMDESLFTISNEMFGMYGFLVTSQSDSKPITDEKNDPFKEFPEIFEIEY